jgi:uncharacterized protein (TIGR00730 family)
VRAVCVFAGSSPGADPAFAEAAAALGTAIARRGMGLVYGGASLGLMGVVADAALAAGGEVVGAIPRALGRRELAHRGLSELVVVDSMHERKALMASRADAFAALPGGIGTLEELIEVLTWTGLRIHDKPVGVLDVAGYWAPLAALLDHAVDQRFLRPEHRADLLSATDPEALLDALAAWEPVSVGKWLDEDLRAGPPPA